MEKTSLLPEALRSDSPGLRLRRDDSTSSISTRLVSGAQAVSERGLWSGFLSSAQMFPSRPAVVAEGKVLSYEELQEIARRIAATIQKYPDYSATPLTAVLAYRSATAFAGVLG